MPWHSGLRLRASTVTDAGVKDAGSTHIGRSLKFSHCLPETFLEADMAVTRSANANQLSDHARIWYSLKCAIASSSGFKSWKGELPDGEADAAPLDNLVRRYLRETLETLAY